MLVQLCIAFSSSIFHFLSLFAHPSAGTLISFPLLLKDCRTLPPVLKNWKHSQPPLHVMTCVNACPLHGWEVRLSAISQGVHHNSVPRARELSYRDLSVRVSLCISVISHKPFLTNIKHISQWQQDQVIRLRRRTEESALLSSYIRLVHFGWI